MFYFLYEGGRRDAAVSDVWTGEVSFLTDLFRFHIPAAVDSFHFSLCGVRPAWSLFPRRMTRTAHG